MPAKSHFVLIIENLSSYTRSSDIKKEMSRYGKVLDVERDVNSRCALVDFKRSDDAEYAWRKADGIRIDGRDWRVDWANRKDFEFFGWRWTEDDDDEEDYKDRKRSPSRSRSPTPRSPSPGGDKNEGGSNGNSRDDGPNMAV